MKRKPPTELIVGPLVYEVLNDEAEINKAAVVVGSNLDGSCDVTALRIALNPSLAPGQARETLLHEALHALLALTGQADEWGERKEEAMIRRLSPVLLALLRSNPPLVAFLVAP